MKKYLLFLFLLALVPCALAQISITSENFLGAIGTTTIAEFDTSGELISVNPGPAGANQIWDFTGEIIDAGLLEFEFLAPAQTPYAAEFPQANYVEKFTVVEDTVELIIYEFYDVTPQALQTLGTVSFLEELQLFQVDPDTGNAVPLPIEYGSTWREQGTDTITFFETFIVTDTEDNLQTVDAWGTVNVPGGSFNCLRVRSDWQTITRTYVAGMLQFEDTTSGIDYLWISNTNFLIAQIESLDDETDPGFTQASWFARVYLGTTDIAAESLPVNNFELSQNYPNPFNPSTSINFSLPSAEQVRIDIYNTGGEKVTTLTNEKYGPGNHSISFTAGDLASGVYIYRIQAGQLNDARKMILVK